jgi:hypothetical protein
MCHSITLAGYIKPLPTGTHDSTILTIGTPVRICTKTKGAYASDLTGWSQIIGFAG